MCVCVYIYIHTTLFCSLRKLRSSYLLPVIINAYYDHYYESITSTINVDNYIH